MIVFLSACVEKDTAVIEKQDLFHLSMGKTEDAMDLIQLPGIPFKDRSRLVMKNGLFYISNGNSGKVMEFNSYGDILSLYYNTKKNPVPLLLEGNTKGEGVSNRKAFPYSFNHIGEIEVTSKGELLVDDEVPANRVEYDDESASVLNRVVLLFSKEGKLSGYLGQEGLGGTPFPYIDRIAVNNHGDIVVFTRTIKTRVVYWFTSEGSILYTITFPLSALPGIEGKQLVSFLDDMTVSRTEQVIFLKIDYYSCIKESGESENSNPGDYLESRIWEFSVPENRYTGSMVIPRVKGPSYGVKPEQQRQYDYIYTFLGCDNYGRFFFLVHLSEDHFQLLVLASNGTVLSKNQLNMDDSEITYSSFYLTETGLLTALLAKVDRVDIVWWRSDKIKGARQDEAYNQF